MKTIQKLPKPKELLRSPKPTTIVNKASRQAMLPSRAALRMLTKGDPSQQTIGSYAKATPSGAAAVAMPYAGILDQGVQPNDVVPALQQGSDE